MERVARMLGFNNFETIKAKGIVEGLILMWIDEIKIEVEWKSDRIICGDNVDHDGKKKGWSMFASHGTPYNSEKPTFWEDFKEVIKNVKLPWLVIGDLNKVIGHEEKFRGRNI